MNQQFFQTFTAFVDNSAQIDQAQQLAGQFQASPTGVQQLMRQYGKTRTT